MIIYLFLVVTGHFIGINFKDWFGLTDRRKTFLDYEGRDFNG
jgi:hypothetical protein